MYPLWILTWLFVTERCDGWDRLIRKQADVWKLAMQEDTSGPMTGCFWTHFFKSCLICLNLNCMRIVPFENCKKVKSLTGRCLQEPWYSNTFSFELLCGLSLLPKCITTVPSSLILVNLTFYFIFWGVNYILVLTFPISFHLIYCTGNLLMVILLLRLIHFLIHLWFSM